MELVKGDVSAKERGWEEKDLEGEKRAVHNWEMKIRQFEPKAN